MYVPDHFAEHDPERMKALIRSHPLGLLVSSSADELLANPLPFHIVEDADHPIVLQAHLARANQQWKHIKDGATVLVVFQAANAYVTPSWYATKREHGKVVPTWNYAMVQASGTATINDNPDWIGTQIDAITKDQETGRQESWGVADAPERFIETQKRAIVGLDIKVTNLIGKWKVSQNRSADDRNGVQDGLSRDGQVEAAALVAAFGDK